MPLFLFLWLFHSEEPSAHLAHLPVALLNLLASLSWLQASYWTSNWAIYNWWVSKVSASYRVSTLLSCQYCHHPHWLQGYIGTLDLSWTKHEHKVRHWTTTNVLCDLNAIWTLPGYLVWILHVKYIHYRKLWLLNIRAGII